MEGKTPREMDVAPAETYVSIPSLPTMHLPVLPTPFIGRERQVAEVCALLDRSSVRLLTLAGPGGIGKTRLALAVASALQNAFSSGVHYISLASLVDPGL